MKTLPSRKRIITDSQGRQWEEEIVVRRLTPDEELRCQGFPVGYLDAMGSDGPKYRAIGNSWATNCAYFIFSRTDMELRRLGYKGTINYATCCSGIEAHSIAVGNLDWKSIFFSEIEPKPCVLLSSAYPDTPNLGDMTQIHYDKSKGAITNSHKPGEDYSLPSEFKGAPIQEIPFNLGDLQVFSGGTPCQSVSIAGRRDGMAEGSGTRSSLAFHYQRIIEETKPVFFCWENVCGALTSNDGADFIWFVKKCADAGYSIAWRVLDAQFTITEEFPRAVPQRRLRIWLVGYKGSDWRIPARIVLEPLSLLGKLPPAREAGKGFQRIEPDHEALWGIEPITSSEVTEEDMFGANYGGETEKKPRAVAEMIPLDEMPKECNLAEVPTGELYSFASKVGSVGYIGSVFRSDLKKDAESKKVAQMDLFGFGEGEVEKEVTVASCPDKRCVSGAERIEPLVLQNIGNAGILQGDRIVTLTAPVWTSGIQLSPSTYAKYHEALAEKGEQEAMATLPSAYDGNVCGLSDILFDEVPDRHNLSWKACYGVLRRASLKGHPLPEALTEVLVATLVEKAGNVKWVSLFGREVKQKPGNYSEREAARECYDTFIEQYVPFDSVEAINPKNSDNEEADDFETAKEDDGNWTFPDDLPENPVSNESEQRRKEPSMTVHSCLNRGGGQVAATLIASGDTSVGTTQDANVVAVQKVRSFSE